MAKPKASRVARVCLTHPDRNAVARCDQCAKPMCATCVVTRAGERFCSEACVTARETYQQREEHTQHRGKAERTSLGEWAVRATLLLLFGAILYYVLVTQHVRSVGDFGDMLRRMF